MRRTSLDRYASVPPTREDMSVDSAPTQAIDTACACACDAIAPAWPLDRAMAVNPHWGRIDRPLRQVAARMAVLGGIHVFPPRDYVREQWERGRVTAQDLSQALVALHGDPSEAQRCVDRLAQLPAIMQLPLLIDVLDDDPRRHERLSWRQAITHQVSQTCAAYFDRHQADWQPDRREGLYAFWRETLTHDHGIGLLMGLPQLGRHLHTLPSSPRDAEAWALRQLNLPRSVWADYLEAVLLTVNGWASWCAHLRWEARLRGGEDRHLRELLAIRLAWGALLLACKTDASSRRAFALVQAAWRHAQAQLDAAEEELWVDEVWQLALDIGYQRQLAVRLRAAPEPALPKWPQPPVEAQAVFCIDVRSERLRRALETVSPAIRTIGFAGFFGLPIAYTPLATAARRPQLPGLMAPVLEISDRITPPDREDSEHAARLEQDACRARRQHLAWRDQWQATGRWPTAAFSFVEAAGIGYLVGLAQWLVPSSAPRPRDDLAGLPARYRAAYRPALRDLDPQEKVDLAARVLQAMGLDHGLAPLVLLIGHGSQSANNPHAAMLDCGACGGQTGEANARVLAQLLNDPVVRVGLAERHVEISPDTWFVAALHNTTTDEIEWFDEDLIPPEAHARLDRVRKAFEHACDQVRRERAPSLGLDPGLSHRRLLARLRRRANDGAQTRPEWGLAGNAALIIAPRHRTRGVVLDGRVFLHDYDADNDPDGTLLESLLTAPMVVAHWINWQYHSCVCDPQRLGSGNKVLHNVVGGRIGVFEGNGGDLRIGLSKQALHDGKRWAHEPLRLTVIVDAPAAAIERVLDRHVVVRQLTVNGWLHLWRFDGTGFSRYADDGWRKLSLS